MECLYQKPIQAHNQLAFDQFFAKKKEWEAGITRAGLQGKGKQEFSDIILDSCCGTGRSSIMLAELNPKSLVVGLDQSGHRIAKGEREAPKNLIFLQGNCEDFWRLCVDHNIVFSRHYILYPNPYPKAEHFKRRWHGHPVFPYLPKIAPYTELRSNWPGYLLEFSQAWEVLTKGASRVELFQPERYLTLFERKYTESGQEVFRLTVESGS